MPILSKFEEYWPFKDKYHLPFLFSTHKNWVSTTHEFARISVCALICFKDLLAPKNI